MTSKCSYFLYIPKYLSDEMVKDRKNNRKISAEARRKKALKYDSSDGQGVEGSGTPETQQSNMGKRSGSEKAADAPQKEGK